MIVVIDFEGKHGSLVVGEVEPTCMPQVMNSHVRCECIFTYASIHLSKLTLGMVASWFTAMTFLQKLENFSFLKFYQQYSF